jgi:hypothetical protein
MPLSMSNALAQAALAQPAGELQGAIPARVLISQSPTLVPELGRAPNGTLLLQQGDQAWKLIATPTCDDSLSALTTVAPSEAWCRRMSYCSNNHKLQRRVEVVFD